MDLDCRNICSDSDLFPCFYLAETIIKVTPPLFLSVIEIARLPVLTQPNKAIRRDTYHCIFTPLLMFCLDKFSLFINPHQQQGRPLKQFYFPLSLLLPNHASG